MITAANTMQMGVDRIGTTNTLYILTQKVVGRLLLTTSAHICVVIKFTLTQPSVGEL